MLARSKFGVLVIKTLLRKLTKPNRYVTFFWDTLYYEYDPLIGNKKYYLADTNIQLIICTTYLLSPKHILLWGKEF